jgi:uncharacterized protein (DUF2164 family)
MPDEPMELPKHIRADAIASLQRYFDENLPEPIGELPAGLLLDYFLEEIGPVIYNRAIADAQSRLLLRVGDLSGELFADPMTYWPKVDAKRKARRRVL